MKTLFTAALTSMLLAFSGIAQATLTFISADGSVYSESYADNPMDSDSGLDDPFTTVAFTLPSAIADDASSSASVTGASASGSAGYDVSLFSPLYIEFDMSASSEAHANGTADTSADGNSSSSVSVGFTTDISYQFDFGAEFMTAFGGGNSVASAQLIDDSTGDLLFDIFVIDDIISPFESVIGGPGTYVLDILMDSIAFADEFDTDFTSGASGLMFFEATPVTAVPLPAALPFLLSALGMLGFARKRKKGQLNS